MGVDISGRKPKTDDGDYFSSNWWGWRPILMLCDIANQKYKLKINTSNWGSNDGCGLRTQKSCDRLAEALEKLIENDMTQTLNSEDDRIQICLGAWVKSGTGQFYTDEMNELNSQYPPGTILFSSIVTKQGELIESAHSCSLAHLKRWINFLRNCGGFKIW